MSLTRQAVTRGFISPHNRWYDVLLPWGLTGSAWIVLLLATSTKGLILFDHDYLLRVSHLPWLLALALFLLLWQVMIMAMMLPTSISVIALLAQGSEQKRQIWGRQAIFIAGYALTWTLFALIAFLGDMLLHWLVHQWFWLYLHSYFIGSVILVIAGIVQLLPYKKNSLHRCTEFHALIRQQPLPGAGYAILLGVRYGLLCIGSCWALMLVMVGLGMRNLVMMALLTAIVMIEKELPGGQRLRPIFGLALLALAAFLL